MNIEQMTNYTAVIMEKVLNDAHSNNAGAMFVLIVLFIVVDY